MIDVRADGSAQSYDQSSVVTPVNDDAVDDACRLSRAIYLSVCPVTSCSL